MGAISASQTKNIMRRRK